MSEMTWEQKFEAIQAIGDASLRMRAPGDWYVSHGASCIMGQFMGGPYGNGSTPQEAVENHWTILTTLRADGYEPNEIECLKTSDDKYVRWNGYRWAEYRREVVA